MSTDLPTYFPPAARTEAIKYVRENGHIIVTEIFKKHGWTVKVDKFRGWIKEASRRDLELGHVVTVFFEDDFWSVSFRSGEIHETIFYWLKDENRFCTFTYRKMAAYEIPDYIETLIARDGGKGLRERLLTYKSSF